MPRRYVNIPRRRPRGTGRRSRSARRSPSGNRRPPKGGSSADDLPAKNQLCPPGHAEPRLDARLCANDFRAGARRSCSSQRLLPQRRAPPHAMFVEGQPEEDAVGFELRHDADITAIAAQLDDAGYPVHEGERRGMRCAPCAALYRISGPDGERDRTGRSATRKPAPLFRIPRCRYSVSATSAYARPTPSATKPFGRDSSARASAIGSAMPHCYGSILSTIASRSSLRRSGEFSM